MGEPKQLLRVGGSTLVERAVEALAAHCGCVALLGDGPVPPAVAGLPRLADAPLPGAGTGASRPAGGGPLAGILAALRWRPEAAWVVAPCDLPAIDPEAVAWLLAQRRPQRWAILPRPEPEGPIHALFALYEPGALTVLEELAATGRRAPRLAAAHPRIAVVVPPAALARAWRGVNTPEELAALTEPGR
jgi:molybdenum cofactor guanylyltransferase